MQLRLLLNQTWWKPAQIQPTQSVFSRTSWLQANTTGEWPRQPDSDKAQPYNFYAPSARDVSSASPWVMPGNWYQCRTKVKYQMRHTETKALVTWNTWKLNGRGAMPKSALPFVSLRLEPLGLAAGKLESTSCDISGIVESPQDNSVLHRNHLKPEQEACGGQGTRFDNLHLWFPWQRPKRCWNRQERLKHVKWRPCLFQLLHACSKLLSLQERFKAVTSCSASIKQSLEIKLCTAAASNTLTYIIYPPVSCSSLHFIITFCCSCKNWAEHQLVMFCERRPTGQISPACSKILRTSVSCRIGTSCGKVCRV